MSEINSAIELPELREGEIYLCGLVNGNGSVTHTILLPGDNDDANWSAQLEWAKSIGGDLPTRVELAVAFEQHRDQFQRDWYWSNQDHEDDSAYAWYQDFGDGYQNDDLKSDDVCRARAVRRLII
ncbi:DUF1566 domain-containing protein [Paraburkholderia acidisoli]|uniref:DUF1566 domain-containing protein n=1 Tax=Paraburkholderia acidisoli TaxID=2571748 RepID=A0A7Z2JJ06_9BURK|nr:DUF1566 domain-containing protein [Paraburkholderia acidisoli]QGZ66306.1 DUF1566 domain-containing protein [Paraburkholderia acidisoli]QGZ66392.1 DUF1566 domain-containing protein [Paraburkholderia acidisoli]